MFMEFIEEKFDVIVYSEIQFLSETASLFVVQWPKRMSGAIVILVGCGSSDGEWGILNLKVALRVPPPTVKMRFTIETLCGGQASCFIMGMVANLFIMHNVYR